MKTIRLQIDGEPIGKASPRFAVKKSKVGKHFAHGVKVQVQEEGLFLLEVKRQMEEVPRLYGPISMDLVFVMPIPKYLGKKKSFQEGLLADIQWQVKKPDLSNMIKFVEDCLTGIAYEDDKQIAVLSARKMYGPNPKTLITMNELGNGK